MTERTFRKGEEYHVVARVKRDGVDADGDVLCGVMTGDAGYPEGYEVYVKADKLIPTRNDAPVAVGSYVRQKFNERVGLVKSISKGYAWVDWQPDSTDEVAFSSVGLSTLVAADPGASHGITDEEEDDA